MGSIIRAKCPCGLSQKVLFGGGLGSHLVFCAFPCYCQDCHWLFEGNLFDERVRCTMCDSERYLPYDDERLRIVELHPEPPPPEYKKQTLSGFSGSGINVDEALKRSPKFRNIIITLLSNSESRILIDSLIKSS